MQSKKKVIGNAVLLLVVFALTIYAVFYGEDIGALLDAMKKADIRWLVPGFFFVLFCIWGESVIIWYMMRSFHVYIKKGICFLISCVGYFFCSITPAAGGGQPMQIYFMKKEKIPIPIAAVILMIITITYKLVLVVIGIGILIFARGFLHHYLEGILPVFYLGFVLNVFSVCFMTALVFHPVFAEKIILKGMDWLEGLRFMRRRRSLRKKFQESMEVYRETAAYLKDHKMVIFNVMLITIAQRMGMFAVTWMVYLAFGMSGTSMWDVVFLQSTISICADMLPLPGGMGISEALFLEIFAPVFHSLTLPAMVISRGIGYYSQLLISAFFTLAAWIYYTLKSNAAADIKSK